MKTEELQKYIQKSSPDLYRFAYVLMPDDLQASQLMIDSVQAFLIQKKSLIEKIGNSKNRMFKALLNETKLNLLRNVYELARKRYQQLRVSFQDIENTDHFYALKFDEKAILYLKEKMQFELRDIEYITLTDKAEVISYLVSARLKMIETQNISSNQSIETGRTF